jgi:hypothetical protein
VASAYVWAVLHTSDRNPPPATAASWCTGVARELAQAGWQLREVTTDYGSEFRANEFGNQVAHLGARQRFIRGGRPDKRTAFGTATHVNAGTITSSPRPFPSPRRIA